MAFTCLVRREIFLEAFLRWMAPFLAALQITGIAAAKSAWAFSLDCSWMDPRTALITLFIRVRLALLRIFLTSFCLARLMADLCVANVSYSFLIPLRYPFPMDQDFGELHLTCYNIGLSKICQGLLGASLVPGCVDATFLARTRGKREVSTLTLGIMRGSSDV
jgi:hypothetical protein